MAILNTISKTRIQKKSHWYKNFLLTLVFPFLIGAPSIILFPAIELWGFNFWQAPDAVRINTLSALIIGFLSIKWILWRFQKFPGTRAISYIFPTVSIIFLLLLSFFLFTRLGYSRHVLLTGYALTLIWFFIETFVRQRYQRLTFGLVPFGNTLKISNHRHVQFEILQQPELYPNVYAGIVADLYAPELDNNWTRFLAQCTLNHIPVYHFKQIQESLTGRIQIEHLSENQLGTLLPSSLYSFIKRIMDLSIVILTAPFTLLIMLIVAVAIKLDSSGNILFVQNRVGQRNQDFKIYKFRSMTCDAEKDGAKLAQANDYRITNIGKFIRKTRIDELPQLFNVLMGDMSLIGPRPEQRAFVNQFENNIPFYVYRHIVKPGMTGWAQVMQGYASNDDDTTIKIQHDFYYIKHFSFWLDILILLKTIRVLITGFGAK